jgi:alcohol dehydrogenase class IV
MSPVTVEFWPKRLVMGAGALDGLADLVTDLGGHRALVICGRTIAASPLLERVKAALGTRFAGVFDSVSAHTPLAMLESSLAAVRARGADILVSVGGGSGIDAGKGTALLQAIGAGIGDYVIHYAPGGKMERRILKTATMPHIAIPTTTGSSSEVMPTAGIRDVAQRRKLLFWDDALVPQAVILDPVMTTATGPFLMAASGMTSVARCVEALYSRHRNPLSEGLALHALRLLHANLPKAVTSPNDLEARFQCQIACTMSGIATINAMASIVHALGHVVGGRYALQHGVSHTTTLAPAMRRFLPLLGERQKLVLEALGGSATGSADAAGEAAIARLGGFIRALPLPQRLRDIGAPAEELPLLAEQATHDYMMANLPREMSAADIEALLREAW